MQTKEYRTVDKSGWGDGPWQGEPDKRQWPDEVTGLPCLIVRNSRGGNFCGYVGVFQSHPAHGRHYDEEAISEVEVHGGLTFAGGCSHSADESRGICHVPDEGEPDDVWWFGFDCAHCWDLSPALAARYPELVEADEVYRTADYVARQCRDLARQLAALASLRADAAVSL